MQEGKATAQPFLPAPAWDGKMRFGFQDTPTDLFLVSILAVLLSIVAALGIGGLVGFAAGVVLVLFLPGYAGLAVLFPADDIRWLQRITFSVGMSIAIVALIGLLSNFAPWGIHIGAILAITDLFTLFACGVAYMRRRSLPAQRRLRLSLEVVRPHWSGLSAVEKTLVVGLVIAVAIAGASIAYSALNVRPPPGFSELYLLNESGMATGYPSQLVVGENATVLIVVANHESGVVNYTIDVVLSTLGVVFNATTGRNQTVEVASVMTFSTTSLLQDGGQERIPYTFHIDQPGDYVLKFLLYRGPAGPVPYLAVRLDIHVA